MAKRICDPTSGKIGNQVYQTGRNGQVVRTRAIPTNPRSAQQTLARSALATFSRMWDTITELQRDAWRVAAADIQTKARLGMSGAMTGNQLFCKINCALAEIGGTAVTDPPALPAFEALPIASMYITNTGGTIAIGLNTTGSPAEGTMLWGAKPVKAGVNRCPGVVSLGTLTSPVNSKIVVTTAYTARYGVPQVGKKVFLQVKQNVDGWEDIPVTFEATVPAST
jgi:hypothetical protein